MSLREDLDDYLKVSRIGDPSMTRGRVLAHDGFAVLLLHRMREKARRWRIPLVNTLLRRMQMILFGVEIGNGVKFGSGVYFVHTLGTVVGGTSQVGARVRFLGNNTLGTAKDNGYPIIEDDVLIGCGARILGPVRVGARSVIGANAVVLADVPPDSTAVGLPARVISRSGA